MLTRRHLLASALLGAGCSSRREAIRVPPNPIPPDTFAPVWVSPDRVIRTVGGLRPYRPSGFVVRRENLGDKILIHNYGHGGGGITLSWGTADLAVQAALPLPGPSAAVIGSGAVGLATARLLQRYGLQVTIYAKDLPPQTTSNIAGGQWWPTSVFDSSVATPVFQDQFVAAARLAYQHYQTLPRERYGIRWVRNYLVSDRPPRNNFILGEGSPIQDLYAEFADLPEHATPFGRYARRFTTMLIEPHIYLAAMLDTFQLHGGKVVVREFAKPVDLQALPDPLVFNCTGLGAAKLFNDKELTPVKGQLTFLLPQPEVNYNLLGPNGLYMFPRQDGILLGGTFERGNWNPTPDPAAAARILAGHQALFSKLYSASGVSTRRSPARIGNESSFPENGEVTMHRPSRSA